ncbi:adenylate/guanylate cyclase domain-containing protein [Chloroflexota bacterium]
MYDDLRKLLPKATGTSEFIIAVSMDIRGFSSFSKAIESTSVAVFLRKVYLTLIEAYFANASFIKPTGDGLLVTIPYSESNLSEVVTNTVANSLKVVENFGSFCENDPMVNFEVPRNIGIGLARGTVCCISSENKTLDYSGRVLNLASRLQDVARPKGVVMDGSFGIELLPHDVACLFAEDSVYLSGIAEREPMVVYYSTDYTCIPPLKKRPIQEALWTTLKDKKTLKQIRGASSRFSYVLPSKPVDPTGIKVRIFHPTAKEGRRLARVGADFDLPNLEYFLEGTEPRVRIPFDRLAEQLEKRGVKDNWYVDVEISYVEYPE